MQQSSHPFVTASSGATTLQRSPDDPVPEPSQPVSPEDMVKIVVDQRHWGAGKPTEIGGVGIPDKALTQAARGARAGPGYQTNAAIQILDAQGNQVGFEMAQFGSAGPHAEPQAISRLQMRLSGGKVPSGKMIVAVDQYACADCLARLRDFARQLGLSGFEVWVPGREAVTPKTAARTAATRPAKMAPEATTPSYRVEARLVQGESFVASLGKPTGGWWPPPRRSVTPSGGTAKPVTSTSGEITVPNKPPTPPTSAPNVDVDTAVVRVPIPAVSDVDEPPATGRAGSQRPSASRGAASPGGNFRAGAGAGGVALATGIATIFINQELQEHFSGYRAEGIRLYIDEALEKANPKFEEVIQRHRTEIEKAQAQGRHVYLRVVIKVRMVDSTDRDPIAGSGLGIGDVAYGSEVEEVQIVYEGDPAPKPYLPDTWLIGDLFRGMLGVSSRYETRTIEIGGTNMAMRRRNEVVRNVEGMMTDPERPFEFEALVVKSQIAGVSKELLREYAGYKRELSVASPFSRDRQAAAYWARMEALADAPIARGNHAGEGGAGAAARASHLRRRTASPRTEVGKSGRRGALGGRTQPDRRAPGRAPPRGATALGLEAGTIRGGSGDTS
jgi:hypothetical protein